MIYVKVIVKNSVNITQVDLNPVKEMLSLEVRAGWIKNSIFV